LNAAWETDCPKRQPFKKKSIKLICKITLLPTQNGTLGFNHAQTHPEQNIKSLLLHEIYRVSDFLKTFELPEGKNQKQVATFDKNRQHCKCLHDVLEISSAD